MKYLYPFFVCLAVFFCFAGGISPVSAQNAIESVAALDKAEHPVFENTYPYPAKTVSEALKEKLGKNQVPFRQKRDLITCKGVVYTPFSTHPLDLYFLMEEKGKKKSRLTTLKLFISKGQDNFIGEKFDSALAEKALDMLNNFQKEVKQYALTQEIGEKEQALNKASSEYTKLLDSRKSLQAQLYTQRKALPMLTGDDLKKTNKSIKKADKKVRKTEKKLSKAEKNIQSLKTELQSLHNELSALQTQNMN